VCRHLLDGHALVARLDLVFAAGNAADAVE
jgi:hypothetical protein